MGNLALLSFVFGMLFATSLIRGRDYWLHYVFACWYVVLAFVLYWTQA